MLAVDDYDLLISNTISDSSKSRLSCYAHSSLKYMTLKIVDNLDIFAMDVEVYRLIGF